MARRTETWQMTHDGNLTTWKGTVDGYTVILSKRNTIYEVDGKRYHGQDNNLVIISSDNEIITGGYCYSVEDVAKIARETIAKHIKRVGKSEQWLLEEEALKVALYDREEQNVEQ